LTSSSLRELLLLAARGVHEPHVLDGVVHVAHGVEAVEVAGHPERLARSRASPGGRAVKASFEPSGDQDAGPADALFERRDLPGPPPS